MKKLSYIFTVLATLTLTWLGFMLWWHFPAEGAPGIVLFVPTTLSGLCLLFES